MQDRLPTYHSGLFRVRLLDDQLAHSGVLPEHLEVRIIPPARQLPLLLRPFKRIVQRFFDRKKADNPVILLRPRVMRLVPDNGDDLSCIIATVEHSAPLLESSDRLLPRDDVGVLFCNRSMLGYMWRRRDQFT